MSKCLKCVSKSTGKGEMRSAHQPYDVTKPRTAFGHICGTVTSLSSKFELSRATLVALAAEYFRVMKRANPYNVLDPVDTPHGSDLPVEY